MRGNCTKISLLAEALDHISVVSGGHHVHHALTSAGHGQGGSWSPQLPGSSLSMLSSLEGGGKGFGLGDSIPDTSFLVVEVMLLWRRFSICQGLWVKAEKEN